MKVVIIPMRINIILFVTYDLLVNMTESRVLSIAGASDINSVIIKIFSTSVLFNLVLMMKIQIHMLLLLLRQVRMGLLQIILVSDQIYG